METSTITVLIVDDDISLRNLLKTIVVRIGYNVTEAGNPIEAFAILKNLTPSLIILDMLMPLMDGASMLDQIRKNENLKNVPVIICTSLSDKETVLRFATLGVHEFLLKPFATTTAIHKIRKVIEKATETTTVSSVNGTTTFKTKQEVPPPYTNGTKDETPANANGVGIDESEINVEISDPSPINEDETDTTEKPKD